MALQGDSTTIMIRLDLMLVKKKTSLSNLSVLEKGKVKSIRFSSLEAICRELYSQPCDILE
jgi:putative transcriptional regulator